jgi:hypothetical protein
LRKGALATKQSILSLRRGGLLRRFAPRNDDEILFGCLKIESSLLGGAAQRSAR